eukprot:4564492-Prymnesium_polylepis.1
MNAIEQGMLEDNQCNLKNAAVMMVAVVAQLLGHTVCRDSKHGRTACLLAAIAALLCSGEYFGVHRLTNAHLGMGMMAVEVGFQVSQQPLLVLSGWGGAFVAFAAFAPNAMVWLDATLI